jgi:hypothetical protein
MPVVFIRIERGRFRAGGFEGKTFVNYEPEFRAGLLAAHTLGSHAKQAGIAQARPESHRDDGHP